jgi:MFS family permease
VRHTRQTSRSETVDANNRHSTFGRIIPLYYGDLYGVFNVQILFTVLASVISLALWIPSSTAAPLIVYSAIYGFASGCVLSIVPALVAQISDIRKIGTRVGLLYAVSSFGVLTGDPIAGAIVTSQNGSFSGLKIFCGVTLMGGAFLTLLSRWWQVGLKLKVKI